MQKKGKIKKEGVNQRKGGGLGTHLFMSTMMHCHLWVITTIDSSFCHLFIYTAQSLQLVGRYESYLYSHQVPFPLIINISPAKSAKPSINLK